MPHSRSKYLKLVFSLGDFLILNGSFVLAYLLKFNTLEGLTIPPYLWLWLITNGFLLALTFVFKPYNIDRTTKLSTVLKRQYAIVFLHLLLITAFWVFNKAYYYSRVQLLITFGLFLVLVSIWRLVFVYTLGILRAKGYNLRKIVIVGSTRLSNRLVNHLRAHPEYGYYVHHTFNSTPESQNAEELQYYILNHEIDELYCCFPNMDYDYLKHLIDFGHQHRVKVKLIGNIQGHHLPGNLLEAPKPEWYGAIPVINVTSIPLDNWWNRFVKRLFDIAFSLLVIGFVFTWLLPVIAIAIKVTSRGPVFFRQKRTGLNGRDFMCWKFRTMRNNNDADTKQATKHDPRVTAIGAFLRKTSLDELPQFFNVLVGNMSVVGPRPHPVKLNEQYSSQIHKFNHRHSVKPVISVLEQAKCYRGETATFDKMNNRVRLDRLYVERWLFALDIKIIF
ncbi:MAG: exopolysaccharide biosynthesis polyprenyl glycosylphosphotransferase [Cyclobacteriaceae bacterium]